MEEFQVLTGQYLVESWLGNQDSWSVHATWFEAKEAARRPADWARIWGGEEDFTLDPLTGVVEGPKNRWIVEAFFAEEEDLA